MRLIDADALKEELELSKYIVPNDLNRLLNSEINRCIEAIDNAPTVEQKYYERIIAQINPAYEARPQGEWIDYDNTFYKCPECGYLLEKCCPVCQNKVILPKGGAEMEIEDDGSNQE